MTKLFGYQFRELFKTSAAPLAAAIVTMFLGIGLDHLEGRVFEILTKIMMVGTLLLILATLLLVYLISWRQLIDTFYSRKAYLMRTIGLTRLQLFASCFLSFFAVLLLVLVCALAMLASAIVLSGEMVQFRAVLSDLWTMFAALCLEGIVQAVMMWLIGVSGILFGYSMKSSHLGWSVLFAIGLYFLSQIVSLLLISPFFIRIRTFDDFFPGVHVLRNMLLFFLTIYGGFSLVLACIDVMKIQKGIDVDE